MVTDTRTRTKQPEVRRDQLLDAAEQLFATKSISETTVADISEAAGVAKGTFYLYFPSKDHAIIALKERLCRSIVDRFIAVLAPSLEQLAKGDRDIDLRQVIRDLIDDSFAHGLEKADTFINLFRRGDSIEVDRVALAAEDEITETITQAFERLNDLGLTSITHPSETARILFSGVNWALERALAKDRKADLEKLKEASVEVVVRTLALK